jgi:hypothetical protein
MISRSVLRVDWSLVFQKSPLPRARPAEGPIALQHHGAKKDGVWVSPPSLVQFRNISIKELR